MYRFCAKICCLITQNRGLLAGTILSSVAEHSVQIKWSFLPGAVKLEDKCTGKERFALGYGCQLDIQ